MHPRCAEVVWEQFEGVDRASGQVSGHFAANLFDGPLKPMHERPWLVENNSNAQKRAAVAEAIPRLHGSFAMAKPGPEKSGKGNKPRERKVWIASGHLAPRGRARSNLSPS